MSAAGAYRSNDGGYVMLETLRIPMPDPYVQMCFPSWGGFFLIVHQPEGGYAE